MGRFFATLTHALCDDESGASMVEYSLLIAMIAGACVAAVTTFGSAVNGTFTTTVAS
jgi:pilus assembly protein Flp/PilA